MANRHLSRSIVLQSLFEWDLGNPKETDIKETIKRGKTFGGENSGKFINGVLGAVYKEMGEPDKEQTGKKKGTKNENGTADPANLPEERLGGALVYSRHEGEIYLGLVHDVFGYWTFSKGKLKTDGNVEKETVQKIKQEIGLDVVIKEKLGENEYVASHPEHGKTLKKVAYFLAESEYKDLVLEKSGGLDAARWFPLSAIPELRVYNDIIPLITKAVEILSGKKL